MTKIDIDGGKYSIIHDNGRGLHVLRYGEVWKDERECAGDKFLFCCAQEIEDLRDLLEFERVATDRKAFTERCKNEY